MKLSVIVFIYAMLGLVFLVVIATTSGYWRKVFKGRNYIQILIVVPLTIAALLVFHKIFYTQEVAKTEQNFSYGIATGNERGELTGFVQGAMRFGNKFLNLII